jgi:hypothetical protein
MRRRDRGVLRLLRMVLLAGGVPGVVDGEGALQNFGGTGGTVSGNHFGGNGLRLGGGLTVTGNVIGVGNVGAIATRTFNVKLPVAAPPPTSAAKKKCKKK